MRSKAKTKNLVYIFVTSVKIQFDCMITLGLIMVLSFSCQKFMLLMEFYLKLLVLRHLTKTLL